ncbi:MAG TPA: ATP-binding protein [Polyangiales bacterium]|nr:ATP-binding protein [Polyangiales bacterium]
MNQTPVHPTIVEQVRAEQVRTLFTQTAPVLLTNVLNALIVSIALWSRVSHTLLVGWTASMTLMALARIEMRRRYWHRERTPAEQAIWGRRFTLGSLSAGALWGFAGYALLPESLPHQVLILLVLGGMSAGAAASIACFMPAYYAYLLPALLPALVRLLSIGDSKQLAMAAMLVLFVGALTLVARNVNGALSEAFRLRFENARLLGMVSNAQASLVEAHEQVLRANEQLESRVRQRTEELRVSERQLSEIVSESPDAILVLDESGVIVAANPATERVAARPLSELIGKHFAATGALATEDTGRALETFARVVAGEEVPQYDFRLVRPNGQIAFIEAKLRLAVGIDGTRRVHSVVRDVTERHRLQRLKDAYEARLRETERLESVGMLAGGVAHDFNNLLTMILGNVDLLEQVPAADAKSLLEEIRHGSLQAANLTKQLLAFSRQQLLDVKPTDVAHMISDARAMFERVLGAQTRLSISLPADPMVVMVDGTQLEQAILNLLINARHAMPQGGQVELEVRRVQVDADSDWFDAEPGVYVRLAVSDTGTGMDEATRRRVFEPFFTTKELGRGTGLGLSSVHGLIKQAGGHIRVLSEAGRGSRFEILLPYHAASALAAAKETASAWSPGSGTVLLVDDQLQVRRSLQRILEDAGYEVMVAEDGEHALALVRQREPQIDLLISDVIMPGISGIQLSQRLLGLYPRLAILLISGYAGSELTSLRELGERVQFLQKPFDAATLTSVAQTTLQRARALIAAERAANLTN